VNAPASSHRLPFEIAFGWGFGTLGVASLYNATNILALNYMTNVMGIGAGLAGLLIAGSKLYDAVADPVLGAISDRTHHRHGRRRPFLLWGGLLLAVSALLVFGLPHFDDKTAAAWYMGFALVFYATAYSIYNVPYIAMVAEITDDFHERTRLMSFRVQNVSGANILANSIGPLIIAGLGSAALGHQGLAVLLAVVILASSLGCYHMTRNARFIERTEHVSFTLTEKIAFLAGNRPFVILLAVKLLGLMALSLQAVFPILFTKVIGLGYREFGFYFLIYSSVMLAVTPLWVRLGRRIGKRNAFVLSLIGSAAIMASWWLAEAGDPFWTVALRAALYGVTGCGTLMMGQALLPDTIEYDRLRTGMKREGIYAGLYTTVEKIAGAFSAGFAGIFLGAMGFVASQPGETVDQPESAVLAIYIAISAFPVAINATSALLLMFYDLTEDKLAALRHPVSAPS
jgi:GPH family glycoside/pentoside/hexuronide:cation symporter